MKSIKAFFFGLVMVYPLFGSSQAIKTYSGALDGGKASYQYYEDKNMDRVFHGYFNYTGTLYNMKGNYDHGKKVGKWDIFATNKKFSCWAGSFITNTKIVGEYKYGELEGYWTYMNSVRFANQVEEDKEISTASFRNNHFVGKFTYQSNWEQKYSVVGQFDSLGYMSGTWIFINGFERDEIRFLKGIAYWRLWNNTTNGEKKLFCDSTEFVNRVLNTYDTVSKTSTIDGVVYYLDTIFISSNKRVVNFENSINTADLLMPDEENFNPIGVWQNKSIYVFRTGALDNPLYYFENGSVSPVGMQIVIKECKEGTDCYKALMKRKEEQKIKEDEEKRILEEKKRIADEKARIEKERLETLMRKEKHDIAIKNGDVLFESKKFREALSEYIFADSIDKSGIAKQRIKAAKLEITRIDSLQKLRLDTYSNIRTRYDKISLEMPTLKMSLLDKKKKYGKNYELCMNVLSANFSQYFSRINSMFPTGLNIDNSWNQSDQDVLDLLMRFKGELKDYEYFHLCVKYAFDTENEDQLKILKSSDDLKVIIEQILKL
jgi:hypothetical protein